jgi:hypothetical protein
MVKRTMWRAALLSCSRSFVHISCSNRPRLARFADHYEEVSETKGHCETVSEGFAFQVDAAVERCEQHWYYRFLFSLAMMMILRQIWRT